MSSKYYWLTLLYVRHCTAYMHACTTQALKKVLPGVIVQGIPSISRAVICHEEGVK
jgi:hypothetical protein